MKRGQSRVQRIAVLLMALFLAAGFTTTATVFVAILHSAPATASEWAAYDAVRFNIDMPKDIPLVHHERAYTSAIWHTP